jgi:hypothetical protein
MESTKSQLQVISSDDDYVDSLMDEEGRKRIVSRSIEMFAKAPHFLWP